mgnify:CR=1 FL=1
MKNHKEAKKYLMNGDDYRLIPSYLDRPAFYSIIKNDSVNNHDIGSYQWKAYHYFNRKNETLNDNDIEEMFINELGQQVGNYFTGYEMPDNIAREGSQSRH